MMLVIVAFAVSAAWAQDPADEPAPAPDNAAEVESEEDDDEFDIDSQEGYTEEDEGDFKPTDDVSYEQSVQFPVDI